MLLKIESGKESTILSLPLFIILHVENMFNIWIKLQS